VALSNLCPHSGIYVTFSETLYRKSVLLAGAV